MPLALTDLLTRGSTAEGRLCEGIPLAAFPRLAQLLPEDSGGVQADVCVSRDAEGIALVQGSLSARVRRECQRCLEAMDVEVEVELRLAVTNPGGEGSAPPGFDIWQIDDGDVILRDLLEDELLLSLPLVARHEDTALCGDLAGQSAAGAPDETSRQENPFAVLEALKRE